MDWIQNTASFSPISPLYLKTMDWIPDTASFSPSPISPLYLKTGQYRTLLASLPSPLCIWILWTEYQTLPSSLPSPLCIWRRLWTEYRALPASLPSPQTEKFSHRQIPVWHRFTTTPPPLLHPSYSAAPSLMLSDTRHGSDLWNPTQKSGVQQRHCSGLHTSHLLTRMKF